MSEATPNNACTSGDPHAGKGGVVPPPEHRWQPGQSGNPKGRPSAGAAIVEWVNALGRKSERQLRLIARSRKAPWPKRAAALRILRTLEDPDLADFQEVLDGTMTLKEARERGIDTAGVKKLRRKVRSLPNGDDITETEIELHDRGGENFDRVCDRTEGRPTQRQDRNVDVTLRTPDDGAAKASEIVNRLKERLGLRSDN